MSLPAVWPGTMGRGGKKARALRKWVQGLLAMGLAAVLGVWVVSFYVEKRYADRIIPRAEAPQAPVALVYGAGLAPGGVPSPVLAQRLDAAIAGLRGENGLEHEATIVGAFPVIAGALVQQAKGHDPIAPDPNVSHAADTLHMLLGRKAAPREVAALDAYLVTVINWTMATPPIELAKWPALKAYYERLRARPSVAKAVAEEFELYKAEIARHKAAA